jgi:hypothetical protein
MVGLTNQGGEPKGSLTYNDPSAGVKVQSTRITAVVVYGNYVRVFGKAAINGTGEHDFVVDAVDSAESGRNADYFSLTLVQYASGGTVLTGGNIQVQ